MTRLRHALALACTILGTVFGSAVAQDSDLRPISNGIDAARWTGVGRLEVAGKGFCTGALISDRLVLTAAHCLFDRTGNPVSPEHLSFAAGLRGGAALATRRVARMAMHPEFVQGAEGANDRLGADIALLELDQPIRGTRVRSFALAGAPRPGAAVGVVSYGVGREETPSLQRVCSVLDTYRSAMVMSCEVEFGSSGAPVFLIDDGAPRIVGVVTAKASLGRQDVSVSAVALDSFALLQSALRAQPGGTLAPPPGPVRMLSSTERNDDIGAKFIRP